MKNQIQTCLAAFLMLTATSALAADVSVYDSVVSLATNVTKNYTFTDPTSGQSVVIAVTMSPYTSSGSSTFSPVDANTHLGIAGNVIIEGDGVNFSASLVSATSGVTNGSVAFGITDIGIRPVDSGGNITWTSAVTGLNLTFSTNTEILEPLDTADTSLSNGTYSAQLAFPTSAYFQLSDVPVPGQSIVFNATFNNTGVVDPRTNSWFTTYSAKYARIYTSDLNRTNGVAYTTWTNGSTIQSLPAYCGIQEVYSSSNYVYAHSTGLGSHIMGAWYGNTAHTVGFPTYPTNQHVIFKIPRYPAVPATKTLSGGGAVGIFVDGVAMYNNWDAFYWNGTVDTNVGGTNGYWNRDAYVNEGPSFDPANAHQPQSGQYHYHANPPALRYELGDHVDFNSATKIYTEDTNTPTKHSPILGWAADGFPIYGPYGYSVATNPGSGVRRMISGFVIRNGEYGTSNLTANGRTTIPAWAARLYNVASNVMSGPAVSTSYPLGRYMEDNDYLGDHGYVQGVDFDLDQYNGRWCVTPDFPGGTYAYFVAISSNGTPVYPYNIGFGYYGSPAGGSVTAIQDTVVTNFLGDTNVISTLANPAVNNSTVTLAWSAVEGGGYQVQGTTNFSSWTVLGSNLAPNEITGGFTNTSSQSEQFYRVARTSLSNYDSVGAIPIGGGIASVSPTNASPGSTFTLTINLNSLFGPPPSQAPVNSITIGSIAGTGDTHVSATQATCSITIPNGTAAGPQTVTIVFPGPPQDPTATQTFYLTGGFTVN